MHFGGLAEEVRGEAAEVRVSVVETTGSRHADGDSRCGRTFSAYFGLWLLCWIMCWVPMQAMPMKRQVTRGAIMQPLWLAVGLRSQSKWRHRSQSRRLWLFVDSRGAAVLLVGLPR